jgi:AbrB family looped-hinge helix DNA binding protein
MAAGSEGLTTVISTTGGVILPKAIRDRLHWTAGMRLTIEETADGIVLKPAPRFAPTSIDAVFGSLAYDAPALTLEEMDAAIAAQANSRARDG